MSTRRPLLAFVLLLATVAPAAAQWVSFRIPRNGACFFTNPEFKGDRFCIGVAENLPTLSAVFSRKISSVRLYGKAEVQAFSAAKYEGQQVLISTSVSDLRRPAEQQDAVGWNDRILSLKVVDNPTRQPHARRARAVTDRDPPENGACLFEAARYRGASYCLEAGKREALPENMAKRVSSVRVYGRAHLKVFDGAGFDGYDLEIWSSVRDLREIASRGDIYQNWNDRIASVEVLGE